jgi:hypothetical protein
MSWLSSQQLFDEAFLGQGEVTPVGAVGHPQPSGGGFVGAGGRNVGGGESLVRLDSRGVDLQRVEGGDDGAAQVRDRVG